MHSPFSICFHTFRCISKEQKSTWRNRDIAFVLIASVFLTFALSANVFENIHVTIILTCVSALVAACGAYVILCSQFNDESKYYKMYIVGTMLVPVILCLFPMMYKAVVSPSSEIITYVVTAFLALIIGLLIYVASVPERFAPGVFDLFGYSHHLMHICLIVAYVAEFMFIQACIKLKQ